MNQQQHLRVFFRKSDLLVLVNTWNCSEKIFSKENEELVSEQACTVLTISLNNDGEIFTTFLGAYNKDILKLLKNTQKTYYKNLAKKLKKGDIIVFNHKGKVITHRVVGMGTDNSGKYYFRTKGDANIVEDPIVYEDQVSHLSTQ